MKNTLMNFQNPVNKFLDRLPMKILVLCTKLDEYSFHKNLPSLEKRDFFENIIRIY